MEHLPQVPHGGHRPPAQTSQSGHVSRTDFEQPGPAAGADLGYMLRVLAGRKWLIGFMVVTITALSAVGVSMLSDKFTSEALLLVDDKRISIVRDPEPVAPRMPGDDSELLSEVEIIKSNEVLTQVIADLKLADNPEFARTEDEDASSEPLLAQAVGLGHDLSTRIWGDAPPAFIGTVLAEGDRLAADARTTAGRKPPEREAILKKMHRGLTVGVAGRSRVIQVRYTAKSPELAAGMVNAIVGRYMEMRHQMDREMADKAIDLLRQRSDQLRQEVVTAEQEVEQVRFRSGLTRGIVGPLAAQELEQARQRMSEASAGRARLVAQAETLERALRSGNWATIGGSITSPVVGQLRATLATLQSEMAQFNKQYGNLHPRVVEQRARIEQANAALNSEIQREIAGVREAANVAVDQEKALKEQITRLEGSYASNLSDEGVKLRTLEADAQAKRTLMEGLLRRLHEVQAVQDDHNAPAGVKMVSAAQVPFEPSGPQRTLLIAAGFIASLCVSVFLVFALELLQRRVRAPDTLRRILGVGAVHIVPHHPVKRRTGRLYDVFQRHPFSLFAESMRALFRNHFSDLGPVGAIAVTSARPQDGKTSLSLAVAQVASQAGRRVVVVDTDFRRSRVDHLFNLSGQAGLADWLAGKATLDEIVYGADEVPFALVPAGSPSPETLDRFNLDAVQQLMAGLSTRYDLVVFDTAPALAVSDARIVCAAASKVLFVTRWGHTTAGDLQGIADLGPIDHSKFVCVMTDVDLKKAAARGYSGPYRNYVATKKYYNEPPRAWAAR